MSCGSLAAPVRTLQAWALTPGLSPTRSGCRGACAQGPSYNLHSRDIPLWRQGHEGHGRTHMGRLSKCCPAKCSLQPHQDTRQLPTAPSHHSWAGEAEVNPPPPQEHSPVSGSHWCSQGSRRRRAQRSRAQGPLEFCWEKRTTCAGFSQSLASS